MRSGKWNAKKGTTYVKRCDYQGSQNRAMLKKSNHSKYPMTSWKDLRALIHSLCAAFVSINLSTSNARSTFFNNVDLISSDRTHRHPIHWHVTMGSTLAFHSLHSEISSRWNSLSKLAFRCVSTFEWWYKLNCNWIWTQSCVDSCNISFRLIFPWFNLLWYGGGLQAPLSSFQILWARNWKVLCHVNAGISWWHV